MARPASTQTLSAGYAKGSVLLDGELHLIGMYSKKPRLGTKVRDELMVRAVALAHGKTRIVLAACDLLCISEELYQAVLKKLEGLAAQELLLAATHTHSSFGGFFPSTATSAMLGEPNPVVLESLSGRIAAVVQDALDDLQPASLKTGQGSIPGLTACRRQADGPHDDRLFLASLERKSRRPIHIVSSSGHPVVVSEKEPNSVSSDYPGMLCRALQDQDIDPVYFSSALGGLSILFPEFQMDADRHLGLLRVLLTEAHSRAQADLKPVLIRGNQAMEIERFFVPHGQHRTQVFTPLGLGGRMADLVLSPALGRLRKAAADGLPNPDGICVHFLKIGNWALVASAAEMGVTMVRAIRSLATDSGSRDPMVVSQAEGYAGYMHLEDVYEKTPEKGYRFMALYENALAIFGFQMGQAVMDELGRRFG